jgi:hypothetical protein
MFVRSMREILMAPAGDQGGAAGSPGSNAATAIAADVADLGNEDVFLRHIENNLEEFASPDTEGGEQSSEDGDQTAEVGDQNEEEDGDQPAEDGDQTDESDESDESDEAEDPEAEDKPQKGWPESAQKRLSKLVAQRNEAREALEAKDTEISTATTRVQELEAQVAELAVERAQPESGGSGDMSLNAYTKPERLAALESQSRDLLDWCELNPDGGEYPLGDGKTTDLDEQQVRQLRVKVRRDLEVNIPQRRQYLQQEAAMNQHALEMFPELKDSRHELTVRANNIVTNFGDIKKLPGWRTGSMYYAMGHLVAEKLGAGAAGKLMELLNRAATNGGKAETAGAKRLAPTPPATTGRKAAPVTRQSARPDERELVETGTGGYDSFVEALAGRFGQ